MKKNAKKKKASIDKRINRAGRLSIDQDEAHVLRAIEELKKILSLPHLNRHQEDSALINLATAYKHRGEYHLSIETLDRIEVVPGKKNTDFSIFIKVQYATSYTALGFFDEACRYFDETINDIKEAEADPLMAGGFYLEAGKAYSQNDQVEKAEKCWKEACSIFEKVENETEHLARAKSNLGYLLIRSEDPKKQKEGLELIEYSSNLKRLVGDIEGLSSNYCNLGLYYWQKGRYERAIAYTRKDLFLSRKVGNLRAIGSTLGNLAAIYSELKQLSPARKCLNEAIEIGKQLNDERLVAISEHNLKHVNRTGKEAGVKGETVGPSSLCACESGKKYNECCGQADFEPIDIPIEFGGVSEEIEPILQNVTATGNEPSRLDFIFRDTKKSGNTRLAWTKHYMRDGWFEMHELPDMANHHLVAANILSEEANEGEDSDFNIHKPLACLLLSACTLESFINQVSFFLHEVQQYPEKKLHDIPPELAADPWEFQRTTELTKKWDILGQALCKSGWPPPEKIWNDFKNLINIRNELVHFKISEYEQVVPPQKKHPIIEKVPKTVQTRNIPHAWPSRLLTPSFANWAVTTSDGMIDYFKKQYMATRLDSNSNMHPTQPVGSTN